MTNRALMALSGVALALAACGDVTPADGDDDADAFVPLPDPTIGSISPDHGPLAGGTTVTLTGSGFTENAQTNTVIVGAFIATDVTVNSDTELTFVTPPGATAGSAVVTVFNEAGAITSDVAFTYNPLPTIAGIDVDTGVTTGGLLVTLTGSGFTELDAGTNTVDIGGTEGTSVQVVSDGELTFRTGAHTGAIYEYIDVNLTNDNGTATLPEAFRYLKPGLLAAANSRLAFEGVDLIYIDPDTADTISLGLIGGGAFTRGISGMQPTGDGRMYAAATRAFDQCCDRVLVTFNPLALDAVSPIGTLINSATNNNRGIQDLARVGNTLYGINESSHHLVTINTSTGQYTDVGPNPLVTSRPAQLTPDGANNVYWTRDTATPLRRINVVNGTSTDVVALNGAGEAFGGIALFNGTLYAVLRDPPARLLTIDVNTGAMTDIGEVPFFIDSLVATPW